MYKLATWHGMKARWGLDTRPNRYTMSAKVKVIDTKQTTDNFAFVSTFFRLQLFRKQITTTENVCTQNWIECTINQENKTDKCMCVYVANNECKRQFRRWKKLSTINCTKINYNDIKLLFTTRSNWQGYCEKGRETNGNFTLEWMELIVNILLIRRKSHRIGKKMMSEFEVSNSTLQTTFSVTNGRQANKTSSSKQ